MDRAVLVEGESDRIALLTLARLRGQALGGDDVVAMGSITNIRAFAHRFLPTAVLYGLYDAPEERHVRRGLTAAGLAVPADLAEIGFFACTRDLEDELVRALGLDGVEEVIASAGEAGSLRLLAGMPAQRDWTREQVIRRFFGSQGGRKARYARLLIEALGVDRAPAPLVALLDRCHAEGHGPPGPGSPDRHAADRRPADIPAAEG